MKPGGMALVMLLAFLWLKLILYANQSNVVLYKKLFPFCAGLFIGDDGVDIGKAANPVKSRTFKFSMVDQKDFFLAYLHHCFTHFGFGVGIIHSSVVYG